MTQFTIVMVNLTISTLADYLTCYAAFWVTDITSMIFTRQYGTNEIYFHFCSLHKYMANYSTPPRSKSETVIKFKRPQYEQKY